LTDEDNLIENLNKVLDITWGDFKDMQILEVQNKQSKTLKPISTKQYDTCKYTVNDNLSTNSILGLAATLLVSSAASLLLSKKQKTIPKIKQQPKQQQQPEEEEQQEEQVKCNQSQT
jgi:hypothetical protein